MPMPCTLQSSLHLLRTFTKYPLSSYRISLNTHLDFLPRPVYPRHFSSPSEKPNGHTSPVIDFLEKSCGLSHEEAIKASKHFSHLKTTEKLQKVTDFFKDRGFTDAQINRIVRFHSPVLTANIPNTLQPKLKLIEDLGTVEGQLGHIISRSPQLLRLNIEKNIAPGIAFLLKIVKSNENVITVLKRAHPNRFFSFKKLKDIFLFLENNGIDEKLAGRILLEKPVFFTFKETHIMELFDTVEKLGVPRNSGAFSFAVAMACSRRKDTLERKIKFLVSLGLSKKEVLDIFAKYPTVLGLSEKNLKCHMDFLVNILNLEPSISASYPSFFGYSMEKRILPRYRVFQTLESMGILNKKVYFLSILGISDNEFLDRFVNKHHNESSRLYKIYKGNDPDIPSVNEGNISTMESR